MTGQVLDKLAALIVQRAAETSGTSYTRQLLEGGPEKCARKFGEEAVEAVIAGINGKPDDLRAEAADVVYHLLVLLQSRGVAWSDVATTLEGRLGTSGIAEKAARDGAARTTP